MTKKDTLYKKMMKYKVEAESILDFCNKYHRPFDNSEFGRTQKKECLEMYKEHLNKCGYAMIPKGTSTTGDNVTWYGLEVVK